jgi:hypothetical protein
VHGASVDGSFFVATRTSNIQPSICLIRQLMDEVDFKFDHGTELVALALAKTPGLSVPKSRQVPKQVRSVPASLRMRPRIY